MSFCGKSFSKTHFIIGLLQFATWRVWFGLIWSITWGILIFIKSFKFPEASIKPEEQNNPSYNLSPVNPNMP